MVALRNNGFLSLDNNNENKDGETNWNQKESLYARRMKNEAKKKQPKQIIQKKNKRKILWRFLLCKKNRIWNIQYNSRKKRSCLRKPNYQLNNTCYCGIYSHVHSPSHTAHLIIFSCLLFISLSPAPSLHLSLARSLHIAVSIAISVSTDLFCCSFISFIYSFPYQTVWRWFFWWSFVCAFAK